MNYKIQAAGGDFIYHWFVLMLGALKDYDLSSRINICFDNEDFISYQKETLEMLSDVINVVPNTCDWTLVESVKQVDGVIDVSIYTFLRELFLSRIKNNFDTTEYNKIYIRRDKSHLCEGNLADNSARRRQIVNEQELVDKLSEIGIKSIYFEDYTVEQKIQIFRDASLVVAPQSGGLIFTLFGQQNADIVEIYPPNPHQYCDHYINICEALNIPFRRFRDVTKVDYYDNMIVNPEQLVNFLLGK
jgi:capsular polysaccharide biosynthesis protein